MNKPNKKLKAIALSLGLAAMMAPATMTAQNNGGGLFGKGQSEESVNSRGMLNINDNTGNGISTGNFGEEAPLGSGLALLIGAGLGYEALKKKEDKQ